MIHKPVFLYIIFKKYYFFSFKLSTDQISLMLRHTGLTNKYSYVPLRFSI